MMSTSKPGSWRTPVLGRSGSKGRQSGYKNKRFGVAVDGRLLRLDNVRRFDGASRTDHAWDNLRRDPELWWNHGNCYVHLYGQGQSRRGPAFKVPFSVLEEQKCSPLIERFLVAWDQTDQPDRPPRTMSAQIKEQRAFQLRQSTAKTPGALPGPFQRRLSRRKQDAEGARHQPPDRWAGRVDLYIPAPPLSDKKQALSSHLATRNFFAWAMGRSMVGEHLGPALASLLESMHEFREAGAAENIKDLISYMDEEGYLDFNGQPGNALAALYVAEKFRLRDLYIDAFVHCVGMSETLYRSPDYQNISSKSRRLIRKARADMDERLGEAGSMIRTFLEDDLSESRLGLTSGVRAHLHRFRAFVHSYYATRFGYYPPLTLEPGTDVFPAHVYRSMAEDFEALYAYLVDRSFTITDSSPALAQGGICVLQSVDAFDHLHGFESLHHPLPLLPKVGGKKAGSKAGSSVSLASSASGAEGSNATSSPAALAASPKRRSWFSSAVAAAKTTTLRSNSGSHSPDKMRLDGKLVLHAALMTATNSTDVHLLENKFVCAYRRFEEESVLSPTPSNKFDRAEAKISIVDGRKVRWILVYCMHQTLRACTAVPAEVRCAWAGDGGAEKQKQPAYSLCADVSDLPPWEEPVIAYESVEGGLLHTASDAIGSPPSAAPRALMLEIRPDVDYYALTHPEESRPAAPPPLRRSMSAGSGVMVARSTSAGSNSASRVPARRSSLSSPSRPVVSAKDTSLPTLSRSTSVNVTIRRTLNMLRGGVVSSASSVIDRPVASSAMVLEAFELPTTKSISRRKSQRLSYQEIVVHGYGNGTNDVINLASFPARQSVGGFNRNKDDVNANSNRDTKISGVGETQGQEEDEEEEIPVKVAPEVVANRSASTSSNSSDGSTATKTSNVTTAATSLCSSVPSSPMEMSYSCLNPWDIIASITAIVPDQPTFAPDTDIAAPSPVVKRTQIEASTASSPISPRAPRRIMPLVAAVPALPERSPARRSFSLTGSVRTEAAENRLAHKKHMSVAGTPRFPTAPSRSSSLRPLPLRLLRIDTTRDLSSSSSPKMASPVQADIGVTIARANSTLAPMALPSSPTTTDMTVAAVPATTGCSSCGSCGASIPRHLTVPPRRHPAARHSMARGGGGGGHTARRWSVGGAARHSAIPAIAEDGPPPQSVPTSPMSLDFQSPWDQFPELGGHRSLATAQAS